MSIPPKYTDEQRHAIWQASLGGASHTAIISRAASGELTDIPFELTESGCRSIIHRMKRAEEAGERATKIEASVERTEEQGLNAISAAGKRLLGIIENEVARQAALDKVDMREVREIINGLADLRKLLGPLANQLAPQKPGGENYIGGENYSANDEPRVSPLVAEMLAKAKETEGS